MKKTLALAAVVTALWTASAMAVPVATINLNNYGTGASPIFVNQTGTLAPMGSTFVELLAGTTVVPDAVSGATLIPMSEDGMFFGGTGAVPGLAPNATTTFTLRAWTGAAGSTYDTALNRGETSWSQATGSWDSAAVPPSPPGGPDMQNGAVLILPIPEPSTIALGLLGGAALLFFRRK
jgi:hypothetical protein